MADDLATPIFNSACFFDAMIAKYTLIPGLLEKISRDPTMSKAEVMLIMILFHDSGYRYSITSFLRMYASILACLFPEVVSLHQS